jgi:hypothetical protein
MLPKVEFAYNASRALGIEHTLFGAYFGFSPKEPPYLLFRKTQSKQLRLLHEVHTLVRSVLQLHEDEMQARLEPSTAPHIVKGDKVSTVTTNLFLRGQPNMRLRDRHL